MKEKNLKRQTFIFLVFILLSLGLFALDRQKWLNWLKRPVETVVNPVRRTVYKSFQPIIHYPSSITHQADPIILGEKIRLLEQELALLKVENEEFKKENKKMRHLLGVPLSPSWQFLSAKVLGLKEGILLIDQGSDRGVKEGMTVISPEPKNRGGVLVGRIVRVNPRSSQIMLVSHPQSQITAKLLETGVKGIVIGTLEGEVILEQVLQKENLAKGQLVVTTGEKEQFPQGLLLGQIEVIEKVETEIYQKALLEPLTDLQELEIVFVKL